MPDTPAIITLDPWQQMTGFNFNRGNILRIIYAPQDQVLNQSPTWHLPSLRQVKPRKGTPLISWITSITGDPGASSWQYGNRIPSVVGSFPPPGAVGWSSGSGLVQYRIGSTDDPWADLAGYGGGKFLYGFGWYTAQHRWDLGANETHSRAIVLINLDKLFQDFPDTDEFWWEFKLNFSNTWQQSPNQNHYRLDCTWWSGCPVSKMNFPWRQAFTGDYMDGSSERTGENYRFAFFNTNYGRQIYRSYYDRPNCPKIYLGPLGYNDNGARHDAQDFMSHIILSRQSQTIRYSNSEKGITRFDGTVVKSASETYLPFSKYQYNNTSGSTPLTF